MNRTDILVTAERYGWTLTQQAKSVEYLALARDGRIVEVYTATFAGVSIEAAELWNHGERTMVHTTEQVLDFLKEWGE